LVKHFGGHVPVALAKQDAPQRHARSGLPQSEPPQLGLHVTPGTTSLIEMGMHCIVPLLLRDLS
jgi:hypothetical protein